MGLSEALSGLVVSCHYGARVKHLYQVYIREDALEPLLANPFAEAVEGVGYHHQAPLLLDAAYCLLQREPWGHLFPEEQADNLALLRPDLLAHDDLEGAKALHEAGTG
jgi:hypothetical protein